MLRRLGFRKHAFRDFDLFEVHRVADVNDARMLSVNIITGPQRDLDAALIRMCEKWDLRCAEDGGRDDVRERAVHIDLIDQTLGRNIRKANAVAVAVRFLCQVEDCNVLDFLFSLDIRNSKPPRDVCNSVC